MSTIITREARRRGVGGANTPPKKKKILSIIKIHKFLFC